ncbi:MAG: alcohol dehydrogenase [Planctomycetaceae bacterium]|nr:alcohol dehydrogenase [Planctomycetaceae bacterium]
MMNTMGAFDGRVFGFGMPRLVMGMGARQQLADHAKWFGSKAFVVSDPGVAAQPSFAELRRSLESAGLQVATYTDVLPDPPLRIVQDCARVARAFGADVMVGVGGGSALDVAKIAAILNRHDVPIESMFGTDQTPGRGVPTILLPTTAGTGSEVTPIAVLSDEDHELKRGIVSDHLLADYAIVDPELCLTLPPAPTAYTGMDTLTHAIEAYTNKFAVPLIDAFALEAARLVASCLARAVHDGRDREARYGMALASLLGGLCLKSVNTAAVHALAYPLGGRFHVPHGVANSLLLPHVMRFNAPLAADRYAVIAEAMGYEDCVEAVESLSADVGTDKRMREFGVEQQHLPEMAKAAMEVQRLLKNNPREVTEPDALAIYERAW